MLKWAIFIAHINPSEQELFYCGFWIPAPVRDGYAIAWNDSFPKQFSYKHNFAPIV